jgi:hypothetical protein
VNAEQFISEEITVTRDTVRQDPVSFDWDDRQYLIREIIAVWSDWGFAAGSPRKKSWRMRRHRTCYQVETADGGVYEIYHDRGIKPGGGKWYLHSRLK